MARLSFFVLCVLLYCAGLSAAPTSNLTQKDIDRMLGEPDMVKFRQGDINALSQYILNSCPVILVAEYKKENYPYTKTLHQDGSIPSERIVYYSIVVASNIRQILVNSIIRRSMTLEWGPGQSGTLHPGSVIFAVPRLKYIVYPDIQRIDPVTDMIDLSTEVAALTLPIESHPPTV